MEQNPIRPNPGIEATPAERRGKVRGEGKARRANHAQNAHQAERTRKAGQDDGTRGPNGPQGSPESPAFHVLLERLSRAAQELQENAESVERPSDLAGAMGRAKESLHDALQLGDQLLEAWRAQSLNTTPEVEDNNR